MLYRMGLLNKKLKRFEENANSRSPALITVLCALLAKNCTMDIFRGMFHFFLRDSHFIKITKITKNYQGNVF